MKFTIFIIIVSIFTVFSCVKPKVYPIEPEISFKDMKIYNGHDTLGNAVKRIILTMKIIDGDGDIGLPDDTSLVPQFADLNYKNLFINMYNKVNGEFQKVDFLAPLYYRTPFLTPKGQDKSLLADIEVTMDFTSFSDYDTVKYDFYIYDRKLHKSNIAETPAFPVDTTGIIKRGF